MMRALLDHPWPLEATLDVRSDGFQVLRQFDKLLKTYRLEPVPFIGQAEYLKAWEGVDYQRYSWSALADLKRFGPQFVRTTDGRCRAVPNPAPADLSEDWKCALREAAVGDWRNPQIIVSNSRNDSWPKAGEVEIQFDLCQDDAAPQSELRVLARLDSYEDHPFARSDFDPWDLRRLHPLSPNALPHVQHPCYLPKPPIEEMVLDHLDIELGKARQWAWGANKKYYVPSAKWKCGVVAKDDWRRGGSFPYGQFRDSGKYGWIDSEERCWVWDKSEGHWDVQIDTDDYVRISHTGDLLS